MKYIRVKGNKNLNKLYELFYNNANVYLQRKKIIFDKMKYTSKKEIIKNND
jgi:predicted acetyltransferase